MDCSILCVFEIAISIFFVQREVIQIFVFEVGRNLIVKSFAMEFPLSKHAAGPALLCIAELFDVHCVGW